MIARFSLRPIVSAALLLVLGLANSASALNNYPRNGYWITDGQVNAVARTADTLYIGGNFQNVAPYSGAAALVDPTSGAVEPSFPVIKGTGVRAVLSDGAGGWYLGGSFTAVDDGAIQNLIHILPSGKLDPAFSFTFTGALPGAPTGVFGMDLTPEGVLYIVGQFNSVDGEARSNSASIDTTTGTLTSWAPALTNYELYAVLAVGGVVYLQGNAALAAVDAVTGVVQGLNTGVLGNMYAFALSGSTLYIGASGGLVAYDINTDALTAWSPAPNGPVRALLVSGGTVYVGGDFTAIG